MRALLALVLLLGLSAAAEPPATLPDIEDEVMCVECRTALNVSTAPVADQERADQADEQDQAGQHQADAELRRPAGQHRPPPGPAARRLDGDSTEISHGVRSPSQPLTRVRGSMRA